MSREEVSAVVTQQHTLDEVAARGEAIYARDIRPLVESEENLGKYLVVDVDTGDYEIDASRIPAIDRLRLRRPNGTFYTIRIGFRAAATMGGGWGPLTR